jgi:hypothetical protein
MHSYATTRMVGKFVALVGWAVVAVATVLLLVTVAASTRSGFGLLGLAPAIGIMVGGLLLVCQGQLTQAFADTAMNTGSLVELLRVDSSRGDRTLSAAPAHGKPLSNHASGTPASSGAPGQRPLWGVERGAH